MKSVAAAAAMWLVALGGAIAQSRSAFPGMLDQHPAIVYRGHALTDVVTGLQRDLTAGSGSLAFEGTQGYLRAESQILLFSKTGIQHPFTTSDNPRAWYFNDRVVVGYIPGAPLLELASHDRLDLSAYPLPTSDIAALLVFDHQGHAINLLTRLGWEARVVADDGPLDLTRGDLADILKETVDYFLFVDETPVAAPVQPGSAFAKVFTSAGPRDRLGRSLRELDLRTRLFKYRCSYMIYSPAFDALPGEVRTIAILDETIAGWRR